MIKLLPRFSRYCLFSSRHECADNNIQQRKTAMKVTIREWNAVAAWRWDMPDDDVCGICRNPYDSTCSKCKFPGDECPLRMFTYVPLCCLLIILSSRRMQPFFPHGTRQLGRAQNDSSPGLALHPLMAQARELFREVPYVPSTCVLFVSFRAVQRSLTP